MLSSVWIELEDGDYSRLSHLDPFYIGAHSVVSWEQSLLNYFPKWGHPRSKSNSFLRDAEVFGNQYRSGEGEKGKQRLSVLLENQFWTEMCKVYRASGSIFHFWGQHSLMCARENSTVCPWRTQRTKNRERGGGRKRGKWVGPFPARLTPHFITVLLPPHWTSSWTETAWERLPGDFRGWQGCSRLEVDTISSDCYR